MSESVDPVRMQVLSIAGISITALIGLCIFLSFVRRGRHLYDRVEQALSRFAERPVLASCVIFFWVVGARLLALPLLPIPTPGVHDEFSYLLMADTFAHGRLANPSHPLWISFETFHVNWHPTYSSIYPPAQGFVLAVGQLLGYPWIGVLLADAAMCVAIFWALRGWMPSRWALLAAGVTWLKLGLTSYWMNSYWGGCVPAIGAALVLGGLGRLRHRTKVRDAILLALGIAILANCRPYEGFFICIPVAVWLVLWFVGRVRSNTSLQSRLKTAVLPIACVLALTGAFMGYYNWRLTGSPLVMPRTLNLQAYYSTPIFLWQKPKPALHYNNAAFHIFYNGWLRGGYFGDWTDIQRVSGEKMQLFTTIYLWPGALFILPGLPFALLDRNMKIFVAVLICGAAAIFAIIWSQSHYAAPLTCVFYGLIVQAIRHLRTMRTSSLQLGVALSRMAILLLAFDTGTNLCQQVCDPLVYSCKGNPARADIVQRLERLPGKHLIIVRYGARHIVHDEWVFNGADIDGGKIVWARDISPEQNEKLLAYFKDRQIWMIEPDNDSKRLTPYVPVQVAAAP